MTFNLIRAHGESRNRNLEATSPGLGNIRSYVMFYPTGKQMAAEKCQRIRERREGGKDRGRADARKTAKPASLLFGNK